MKNQWMRMVAAAVLVSLLGGTASAGDWPHWRGPSFNGSAEAQGLPTDFSKTENVKWSAKMPGPAAATPIVSGDRVFISTTQPQEQKLLARCYDRETGELLWENEAGSGYQQDQRSNYASPSPVTNGELVVFFYGQGDLVAYDMEGNELWARNIQADYGEFNFLWTFSSSPTLYEGRLFLQVLQRDTPVRGRGQDGAKSFLLAMNPETGETLYRHVRPSNAKAESLEAFTTPIPNEHNGRKELLIAGGDALSGHDPATGKELWRWGTWNPDRIGHWRLVTSPVVGGGAVLGAAPKGDPIYAVKEGLKGTHHGEDDGVLWVSNPREATTDVPTPLFYDGDFFVVNDRHKRLARVEPKTGEVKWVTDIETRPKLRASPTGADGKIWFQNHGGDVFIYDADSGELINRVAMGGERADMIRSSISAVDGELFIRTNSRLYCIEE